MEPIRESMEYIEDKFWESGPVTIKVEPDLKSITYIKKISCLDKYVIESISPIDERVLIPTLKLKQQHIYSPSFMVSKGVKKTGA